MGAETRALIDTLCELDIRDVKIMAKGAEQSPVITQLRKWRRRQRNLVYFFRHAGKVKELCVVFSPGGCTEDRPEEGISGAIWALAGDGHYT